MAALFSCLSRVFVDRHSIPPPGWTGMSKVLHRFTLEQYSVCKWFDYGDVIYSDEFTAGGHQWVVAVIPKEVSGRDENTDEDVYVALLVILVSSEKAAAGDDGYGVRFFHQMTLLDQSGKGNHLTRYFPSGPEPWAIKPTEYAGCRYFIGRKRLEKSSYLKDDCLKIECRISVVMPLSATHGPLLSSSKAIDSRVDFVSLLDTGYGSDVLFSVRGEEFQVHKHILSVRSSVFRSMFAVSDDKQETFIISMEPRVFIALLHFIYSDTLPEDEMPVFAFGPCVLGTLAAKLLVAAVDYDLKRLKSICETHLWNTISLGRLAETLLLAERCKASVLKCLCLKYAADNHAVLVELDTLKYLRENCPLLLNEVEDYYVTEMKKGDSSSSIKRLFDDVCDC